eukprot:4191234-Prymnesium_polylepis.1
MSPYLPSRSRHGSRHACSAESHDGSRRTRTPRPRAAKLPAQPKSAATEAPLSSPVALLVSRAAPHDAPRPAASPTSVPARCLCLRIFRPDDPAFLSKHPRWLPASICSPALALLA